YEVSIYLEANMDTDPGWTYENQWAWGQPTGQGGQYGEADPTSGHTGNNVVGYNLNGDYPNSMSSTEWVTTQAFDCSDASVVNFTFWAWLGVEQSVYDHAYIAVSNNNGSSWTTIWENSDTLDGGSWDYWEFDISAQAAGYSQVKIRWGMGPTDTGWRYCGWNIDDVMVSFESPCQEPTPTPAPTWTPNDCVHDGDPNMDGEITAGDAQMAFMIALGSITPTYEEGCAADCNGDDEVTAGDAQQIFLTALGSGSCVDPL
nr:choice-of-anchor J domain-containing protein [bacterium]